MNLFIPDTETQVSPITDSHSQQVAEGSSLELGTSPNPWALLRQFARDALEPGRVAKSAETGRILEPRGWEEPVRDEGTESTRSGSLCGEEELVLCAEG